MRKIHGLEALKQTYDGRMNTAQLANSLRDDLVDCCCEIYGAQDDEQLVLLARLHLLPETLEYEQFDQRLDWVVAGPILRDDYPPLTYRLQGRQVSITGRCSMIPRVCGVDLYLHRSYSGVAGDIARQKFGLAVKPLLSLI